MCFFLVRISWWWFFFGVGAGFVGLGCCAHSAMIFVRLMMKDELVMDTGWYEHTWMGGRRL